VSGEIHVGAVGAVPVRAQLSRLGPQGPQLVDAYNKVTDDAARGNLDAREILSKAPRSPNSQPHRSKDLTRCAPRSPPRSPRRRYPVTKENAT